MVDVYRKACLMAGHYMTHTSDVVTYFSVFMRETFCNALTMMTLHDLVFK